MSPDILKQLLADRAAKRLVVLATNLKTGDSALLYPTEHAPNAEDPVASAALQAVTDDRPVTIDTEHGPVFLNVYNPPLRMLIIGAVHISQALAPLAEIAGYQVVVVDPRGAWATSERFPNIEICAEWPDDAMADLKPDRRTAIVTLTHDPKLDDPALISALRSDVFYIGALGSTRTRAKRHDRLREQGFTDADFARIHGPVGLDIGAKSPAEIAVSIVAEVTQVLRRGPAKDAA